LGLFCFQFLGDFGLVCRVTLTSKKGLAGFGAVRCCFECFFVIMKSEQNDETCCFVWSILVAVLFGLFWNDFVGLLMTIL